MTDTPPHWQPTDPTAAPDPGPEPVSSLPSALLEEGFALEALAADPKSAYWRGDDKHSAQEYQDRYLGLIRGELSGAPEAVDAPDAGPDMDLPLDVGRYDYSGLQIFNAADRDAIDSFAPVAFEAGIGAAKMREAVNWALTSGNATPTHFREFARRNHWPSAQVEAALKWYSAQMEKRK